MTVNNHGLRRVLGLGFGLAIAFGGTVGVGILRLPSTLAAKLGDARLIILFWVLGGVYALLGAVSVAELAAMMPEAGGFYVYARRAFGRGFGFLVGLSDWLNEVASLAYVALTAATFLAELWPPAAQAPRGVALGFLGGFTALHWVGIRFSGAITRLISLSVGLMLIVVVIGCFVAQPLNGSGPAVSGALVSGSLGTMAMIGAAVAALRSVFVAYDGWYSPIYMAEESTTPASTLPRSIIGGTLLVAVIYILINVAILRVLPMSVLAASTLPAADAARLVLPRGGGTLVTIIALFTVMSLINAVLLMTPRILLALGRDGLLTRSAAAVSASGTPRVALAATSVFGTILIVSGTFEQIVAIAAALFLLTYVSAYASLIVLRRREPNAVRPYRAFGFPVTTVILLTGCMALWVATVLDDRQSGLYAALLLAASALVYVWLKSRRPKADL
jgi:basic amino acid/polyamine antiporter, APA family